MTLKSSVEEILKYLGINFSVEESDVPHGCAVKIEDSVILVEHLGCYSIIRIDAGGGIWNLPLGDDCRCFDRMVARALGVVISEKIQMLRVTQMDTNPRMPFIHAE